MKIAIALSALLALPLAGCTQSGRPETSGTRNDNREMPPPDAWRHDGPRPMQPRPMPPRWMPPRRPGPPPIMMRRDWDDRRWDDRRGPAPGGPMMGHGPASRPSLDEVFNRMDANKDGSVTREEFNKFHESMRQEHERGMRDRFQDDRGRPTTRRSD